MRLPYIKPKPKKVNLTFSLGALRFVLCAVDPSFVRLMATHEGLQPPEAEVQAMHQQAREGMVAAFATLEGKRQDPAAVMAVFLEKHASNFPGAPV